MKEKNSKLDAFLAALKALFIGEEEAPEKKEDPENPEEPEKKEEPAPAPEPEKKEDPEEPEDPEKKLAMSLTLKTTEEW